MSKVPLDYHRFAEPLDRGSAKSPAEIRIEETDSEDLLFADLDKLSEGSAETYASGSHGFLVHQGALNRFQFSE